MRLSGCCCVTLLLFGHDVSYALCICTFCTLAAYCLEKWHPLPVQSEQYFRWHRLMQPFHFRRLNHCILHMANFFFLLVFVLSQSFGCTYFWFGFLKFDLCYPCYQRRYLTWCRVILRRRPNRKNRENRYQFLHPCIEYGRDSCFNLFLTDWA